MGDQDLQSILEMINQMIDELGDDGDPADNMNQIS